MQLEVLTAERDNLREDLRGTRDAKRLADQSWRAQNGKLTKVEAELAFYQKEVATAVSDRDRVSPFLPAATADAAQHPWAALPMHCSMPAAMLHHTTTAMLQLVSRLQHLVCKLRWACRQHLSAYSQQLLTALVPQASWEAEELRANTLSLEDQLQDAQAQADSMQSELTKREHELSHAHSNIARLEHLARECEAIPGLRADLQDAQARGDELQVARDQLQVQPRSCPLAGAANEWCERAIWSASDGDTSCIIV